MPARAQHPAEAAAEALAPRIRERGSEIEQQRQLPPDLVDAMRSAGLFHTLVPREFGGSECEPVTSARVVEAVSAADGSAGWCVMIASQNSMFAGFIAPEEAQAVFGNGGIACGTARPIGRAVRIGGGYTVSGRWPFASGSSHADWFGGECVVYDGDRPLVDAGGNEVTRMLFVPRASVAVHDTWFTTGLRGTASNDFSVEGVFVPEGRGFQMLVTPPTHASPFYRALALGFVNHGSQALGVARATLETAAELAATKPGWGSDRPVRELPRIQAWYAEAAVTVMAARSYLYAVATELWDELKAGATDQEVATLRARVRLATSHAVRSSVHAVDLMHTAMATSAIFQKSPLERQFRDLHTAEAHVMVSPLTYEAAGRSELGLDAQFPFF